MRPMDVILILCVTIVSWIVIRHIRLTIFSRTAQLLRRFPVVPGFNLPLIYHTHMFARKPTRITKLFQEMVTKYGKGQKMVYMWQVGVPHLLIVDPNVAEVSNITVSYFFVYKSPLHPSPKNIYPYILNASVNMVFESSLGLDVSKVVPEGQLAQALWTITSATNLKIFKPYLNLIPWVYRLIGREKAEREALELITRISEMAINDKRRQLRNKDGGNGRRVKPFLDILLEDHAEVSREEYNEHLLTLAFAGSDTTSFSVFMTLFLLAENPSYQHKCQEEIYNILKENTGTLTPGDLKNATYLEMCWKEAMRMFTPAPAIARKMAKDEVLEDGRVIPKGVDCVIDIYHIHRDPDFYPNPETFDPTRFLSQVASKRPKSHYLPFSMGVRNCLGATFAQLEAMVMLIRILSRFTLQTDQKARDLRMIFGVNLKPDVEILMRLIPRSK